MPLEVSARTYDTKGAVEYPWNNHGTRTHVYWSRSREAARERRRCNCLSQKSHPVQLATSTRPNLILCCMPISARYNSIRIS